MLMNVTWVAQTQKPLIRRHQRMPQLILVLAVVVDHQYKVVDHRYKAVDHQYKADHIHPLLVHHHHTTEAHPIKTRESLRQEVDGNYLRRKKPHTGLLCHVNPSPNMPSLKPVIGTRKPTAGRCTVFMGNFLVICSLPRAKGLLSSLVWQRRMIGGRAQLMERLEYSQQIMSHCNVTTIYNYIVYTAFYMSTAERITTKIN